MAIFEPTVVKEILKVTCDILHNNFFYDDSDLNWFLHTFTEEIGRELTNYEIFGDPDIIADLNTDPLARLHFTCYFVSFNLREIFIDKMHFSDQELEIFDSILPRYTGEKPNENNPKHKRANYRKFFK